MADRATAGARGVFSRVAIVVVAFALAMAYLEAACVVYLQGAIGGTVGVLFPLRSPDALGGLAAAEVGRELATLVMIGTVGWLVGRDGLERLAWSAVVFGAWDIGYYGWLRVLAGWPPSLETTDLLFLIPVPWAGPVWSPVAVSVALIGFGLAAAATARGRGRLVAGPRHLVLGVGGGLLVVLSYTLDAPRLLAGGLPGPYPWPLLVAGIAAAGIAAADVLRRGRIGGAASP